MIFAYCYSDPLLETPPHATVWGREVDRVYQDLGQRAELEQLFNDLQTQAANCLLVRRLEELGDTVEEVSDRLNQLSAMGVRLMAIEQNYNSEDTTPHPRAELLKLLHEIQRSHHSRRIRQGHARNRLKAAPPPGKVPYGYKRGKDKYVIDRTTAPVIKEFFEQFLLYNSLRAAVRYLAKKYGKKISVTTGRRWLTNPVYRGDTAYQGGEIISDTHPAIISREEAAQVDRLLRRNSRLPPRTASAPRSLLGLVVCSECQCNLKVCRVTQRTKDADYLYLRNTDCPKSPKCRAIAYQEVLEKTIATVCRDLPQAVAGVNFPQLNVVKDNLSSAKASQQKILEQIPSLVETGVLDEQTAQLRVYKLRTSISSLSAKLASLPPVNLLSVAQAVSIPQFWLDLSESERRFYFREFIRQIDIVRQNDKWDLQVVLIL